MIRSVARRGRRLAALTLLTGLPGAPGGLAAQVATIEIEPARATLTAGRALQLTAVGKDAAGRAVALGAVVWVTAPFDVGSVEQTGRFLAHRQGRAQVFALAGGRTGTAWITVEPKPPAIVDLAPAVPEIVTGGSTVLQAVARTEDGEPLRQALFTFQTSDPRVATVDPAGVVVGRGEGTAILAATSGPARGEARIRVLRNRVERLSLTGPAQARTGDVLRFRITAEDGRGLPVQDPPVRWSVGGPGAQIEADGAFVAERPGTYLVTATAGAVAGTHAVRVTPRTAARRLELVTHVPLGDIQAAEAWAVGDALYVSTLADRLYVFDIRDPARPVKVDSLLVDARIINDISTTADGRIGVLTREGASSRRNGLVILDLSDPFRPRVLSEYTETLSGGVHSAFIEGHHVYATDDATGSLRIISLADPRQPREVAVWAAPEPGARTLEVMGEVSSAGRYLHDVQVRDGLAYLAYWRHGLVILDVGDGRKGGSPERPQLVSRLVWNVADLYPPDMVAGAHAVFRAGRYVFVGDEVWPALYDITSRNRIRSLGRVHVVDVSDLERPVEVAFYDVPEAGSHNLWVEDDVMYIGYYEAGVRAVDVGGELRGDLRAQGRELGTVWTGSPAGFRPNLPMAWGAQPHRGFVYSSDINSGLWVTRLVETRAP